MKWYGLECENWGETILTKRDGYQEVINEITSSVRSVLQCMKAFYYSLYCFTFFIFVGKMVLYLLIKGELSDVKTIQ